MRVTKALLSIAISSSLVFTPKVKAEPLTLHSNYLALQQAMCEKDWNKALQLVDSLINSRQITESSRSEYIDFRRKIVSYKENSNSFSYILWCNVGNSGNDIHTGYSDNFKGSNSSQYTPYTTQNEYIPTATNNITDFNYNNYSNQSTTSGNCSYSWQRDSLGRICGERATSERPNTSTYTPSSYSGGGSTYVRGYFRKDGTYVRSHRRRRR